MIRALLFDMDGLIVDTEPIQFKAFRDLVREYGHELPESVMSNFVGYHEIDNMRDLKRDYGLPDPVEEMVARRRQRYIELLHTEAIPVFPGFWELSAEAKRRGLKQAVVSSSPREQVLLPLRRAFEQHPDRPDPAEYFDALVCGDEVAHSKPDPEIYLLAVSRLGVEPGECIAFEDTPPGVASAAAAGVTVYAVPNQYTRQLQFPRAKARLRNLREAIALLT